MANSPTDVSDLFVKSGMTLITQPASDRWLHNKGNAKRPKSEFEEGATEFRKGLTK
jgi:hypothetical protein